MSERQGKGMTLLADERIDCCVGDDINCVVDDISYVDKGVNRMFEGEGEAMAVPADERMCRCVEVKGKAAAMPADERMCCYVEVNRKKRQHSSPGRLSWYFAQQRAMPGLIYAATLNGYVASDRDKTKGGKEDV